MIGRKKIKWMNELLVKLFDYIWKWIILLKLWKKQSRALCLLAIKNDHAHLYKKKWKCISIEGMFIDYILYSAVYLSYKCFDKQSKPNKWAITEIEMLVHICKNVQHWKKGKMHFYLLHRNNGQYLLNLTQMRQMKIDGDRFKSLRVKFVFQTFCSEMDQSRFFPSRLCGNHENSSWVGSVAMCQAFFLSRPVQFVHSQRKTHFDRGKVSNSHFKLI